MKIDIICTGNIKEGYLKKGIAEYTKRISAYASVNIIELKEERLGRNPSKAEIAQALEAEGERILKVLPKTSTVISLCIEGRKLNSVEFADLVDRAMDEGGAGLTFIIGSSYGLSEEIKKLGYRVSFSDMTFPHQLMRMILLEQVYRSFKILKNEPYHK